MIDQYPKSFIKELTASPLQMASPLRWEGPENGMPPSHLVPISLEENLIQPVCGNPYCRRFRSDHPFTDLFPACSVQLPLSFLV
jgi:hypothetical protein